MTDKLQISDLQFHAHTGTTEAERESGQRYSVDLELVTDLKKPGETDTLEDAIDYSALADVVVDLGSNREFVLAEALAEAIARAVLERFPAVEEIVVRAKKLHPPVPAIVGYFGVEIRRNRQDAMQVSGFQG